MSGINQHNYEAYLLDSMEGRLTAEQQLELDSFMALHPELAIDLEDLAEMTFDPQQAVFPNKAALKKTGADLVSGEQFIGYIEQQLSPEESLRVEEHCAADPVLAKELDLYKKTIAVADANIVFEDKEKLKRRTKVILFNFRAASFAAAASVLVLLMLYMLWPAKTADVITNSYAMRDLRKASGNGSSATHTNDSQPSIKDHTSLPEHHMENSLVKQTPTPEKLIAHNQQPNHVSPTHTTSITNPDTVSNLVKVNEKIKVKELTPPEPKEPVLIAAASNKTKVDVITENDGEDPAESQKKAGFWAMAGKTLKGLNKAGVKTVNGEEKNNKDNASYALTLGGMSITHKAH
jgi:hypothetical protein